MKREEFLNQLEYLLQDISEEEKRDAIDYYRDYLEEAGEEQEEQVLKDFGSPERIAAIIRTDLLGGMEGSGEFTEKGYEDQRFDTSALPAVAKQRRNREQEDHSTGSSRTQEQYRGGSYADSPERRRKSPENGLLRAILIGFLILVGVPILFSAAVTGFSGIIGIGCVLLALLIVLAALTLAGFLGGIAIVIFGITQLFFDVWLGILCIGLGLAFTGTGCLFLLCSVLFYGKFLPWLFRSVANLCSELFGSRAKKRNKEGENRK